MGLIDLVECPDCGEQVLNIAFERHRAEECDGQRETCPLCGEPYDDYTGHITGGCPERR